MSQKASKYQPDTDVQTPAGSAARYQVLVVDDDDISRGQFIAALERDYEVLSAASAEEGIELIHAAEGAEIHCIISDQRMPGMSGLEFLTETIAIYPNAVRLIMSDRPDLQEIVSAGHTELDEIVESINEGRIQRFITKPIPSDQLLAVINKALTIYQLEDENRRVIRELTLTNEALQKALKNLQVTKVTNGVFWLQVPEADLYILCGCPADIVKHLMRKGYLAETMSGGVSFESGPNAILLSDSLIQRGEFSNLSEFPVLQMMYRQGTLIPNHPNNKGVKPILIGSEEQVQAQMEYIYRGNYGLTSLEEILETGVPREEAEEMFRIKLQFAFGNIEKTEALLDACIVDKELTHIRNDVYVRRTNPNRFEFHYKDKITEVDLTLADDETYRAPYELGFHQTDREYFAIMHTGEGDGWDTDRPCMASIIIYRGEIYLIDAGPGIPHILQQLGIDVSEIKGIFHTHGHDDHFAGLPGLMQGDHQIKYYATPPVRSAVAKKLSALMSMEEQLFYQYFDVCDLEEGNWCDLDGLEVMPIYSPHPVETNIFLFRVNGDDGYKSYAHWADLTSFQVLEDMVEDDPAKPGITRQFCDEIKATYLTRANIKKVDVGGGMIHGMVEDYANDRSDKIILAHSAREYTNKEKEVGSEASFATMDIMIRKDENYLAGRAESYLQEYFPGLTLTQLKPLLESPIELINPGTILLEKGKRPDFIYLIITGTIECIRSEANISFNISTGSFIGDLPCLNNSLCTATYRSVSHVQVLRLSDTLYRTFLEDNALLDQVISTQNNIELLRETRLFGEELSYLVQNKIAHSMVGFNVNADEKLEIQGKRGIFLVDDGELVVRDDDNRVVEILNFGDFLGEDTIVSDHPFKIHVQASTLSRVFFIPALALSGIPIVHWKMLEVWATRKSRIEF